MRMKALLFATVLACTCFSSSQAEDVTILPSACEMKAVVPTVGPVMYVDRPSETGVNYTFYVPIDGVSPSSLRYVWRVSPNDVILNPTYTNEIGITFKKTGWYQIWVDVYYDGGMVSASTTVSL